MMMINTHLNYEFQMLKVVKSLKKNYFKFIKEIFYFNIGKGSTHE